MTHCTSRGRGCSNTEYREVAHQLINSSSLIWGWQMNLPTSSCSSSFQGPRVRALCFKYNYFTWKTTATQAKCAVTEVFYFNDVFMVHLLFRSGETASSERNKGWKGMAVRLIWNRNIMSTQIQKNGEGNYESRVVVHAHSYLICHLSCGCISSCHCSAWVASVESPSMVWSPAGVIVLPRAVPPS